jgi:hypothetical protein
MVNNSTNINKTNDHPSPQIIEHKKDCDMWRLKYDGTFSKVALNTITLTLKLSTLGKICIYTYPDHSWDYNIYSIRSFTFMNDFIFIIIREQFGFLLQNKIWIISNMEKLCVTVTKNVNKTKTILKVPSYFRRHMSQSFLCSMIWGEDNISVILWWSVLLVEETGENHRPAKSHWQTLSHNVVLSKPRLSRIRTHNVYGDRHWVHR